MIEIVNRQRGQRVNPRQWREFGERVLAELKLTRHAANLVFISDRAMRELNRRFRGRDYATDVLSFPFAAEPFETGEQTQLGEVVISLDRAVEQSRTHGLSFVNEVEQLILHGLLHLCGYDHETDDGEMNRLELRLRKKLGI